MKRELEGSLLTTVFVDYDNVYLSLKRKSEEAARAFAKDASKWLQAIASGALVTPTNSTAVTIPRRIVMSRCYGSTQPRRNERDNSTDMNSFPFVRHNFVRAGFEVIECQPLTGQMKNAADIRMVMDLRDYLLHDTYFDEFIILSGDADFTPVLHRLRQHARRTVIFANDVTSVAYRAISDGEVREADLIALLAGDAEAGDLADDRVPLSKGLPSPEMMAEARREIMSEIVASVRAADQPVPLEALADRAVRILGHDRTVGTAWGGMGSFRDLLAGALPADMRLSDQAPYLVFDLRRQSLRQDQPRAEASLRSEAPRQTETPRAAAREAPASLPAGEPASRQPAAATREPPFEAFPDPSLVSTRPLGISPPAERDRQLPSPRNSSAPERGQSATPQTTGYASHYAQQSAPTQPARETASAPLQQTAVQQKPAPQQRSAALAAPGHEPAAPAPATPAPRAAERQPDSTSALQQSVARIYEACQAPPLPPPEYRVLFQVMADEINANGLSGSQTLAAISSRAREHGVDIRRDDVRFVLEVVSEADPWFEQGASANLFASRFRNFVVARCRSQGLQLSASEIDLIEAWFIGNGARPAAAQQAAGYAPQQAPVQQQPAPAQQQTTGNWWNPNSAYPATPAAPATGPQGADDGGDDFPRIVKSRMRG